jgi:hypothetical protein
MEIFQLVPFNLPQATISKPQAFNVVGETGRPDRMNVWAVVYAFSQQLLKLKKFVIQDLHSSCIKANGICLRFLDGL